MKRLDEFYRDSLLDEFPALTLEEARTWLSDMLESNEHYGDCTMQNVSCKMCELTQVLDDYYTYTKSYFK